MKRIAHASQHASLAALLLSLGALALTACEHEVSPVVEEGPLAQAFRLAAAETGVPAELLMAIGWVETRWQPMTHAGALADNAHDESEHGPVAVGLMDVPALDEGARLIGKSAELVRDDPALNVRAAAQLLRRIALDDDGALPRAVPGGSLLGWRDTIARYGAGDDAEVGALYADDVLRVLDTGASGVASTGEHLVLEGRGKPSAGTAKAQGLVGDSPYAVAFLSAREGFFTRGRSRAIDRVVIHTTEGSYAGAISWFRSPNNPWQTSAHYVIRSSDGEITQMVREHDTAHHVFSWNSRSIGVEHEAISAQPHWFTEAMYASSAALVRDICLRYGIPMDRAHIVGHVEVPGNDHTDPGVHWNWSYYMELVTSGQSLPLPGGNSGGGCDGLDYAGVCDGATLTWCENGALRSVNCASSGQTCGWESDAVGNNCGSFAPPPAPVDPVDPCDGLDYAGACDGSTLRWCENGAPRTHDCANEGQTCGWQDDVTGNNCVDVATPAPAPIEETDPCAGLDFAGQCNGTLLEWCDNGAPRSFECASTGQTCGWQNDDVGNNCVAPPPVDPCNGETYTGRCDGATLVWCEDEIVRTFDCASTSQTCGWQNDDIGHNCL